MAVTSKKSNKALLGVRLLMPILALSFLGWQISSMQAKNVDDALLESTADIAVTDIDDYIEFQPVVDTLGRRLALLSRLTRRSCSLRPHGA